VLHGEDDFLPACAVPSRADAGNPNFNQEQ
jgi:hypothetical protein